jgi:SulP family sulfate permease
VILAIACSKWEQAHPNISLAGNVLKIRGNIYYGSLPVIEAMYHEAISREGRVVIDFSECYYIDSEGLRWLAAARAGNPVTLIDRRKTESRRAGPRRIETDPKRATGRRKRRHDRRLAHAF